MGNLPLEFKILGYILGRITLFFQKNENFFHTQATKT